MLPPILTPVTPYHRLCGAIFMVLAIVVGPNLDFAISLLCSERAATVAIWSLVGVYLAMLPIPFLRRISNVGSFVVLVIATISVTLGMVFAQPIKEALAVALGFYRDELPWADVALGHSVRTYHNPFAHYTLSVPVSWTERRGPLEGTSEFQALRSDSSDVALRMRPTCDYATSPLSLVVADLLQAGHKLKRRCGPWHGMSTCLIVESQLGKSATKWQWLVQDTEHNILIRLMFELETPVLEHEVLGVLNSLRPAAAGVTVMSCPNPLQWAELPPE